MGVAGSGKTTVAAALAGELGLELIEGDDYHPPANVEKMRAEIPLTDDDRRPWLETLARVIAGHHERGESTVLACSALRRAYRDVIRAAAPPPDTFVIALDVDPDTLRERMNARTGHFMPTGLLESQLATLEHLGADEPGMTVDANRPTEVVIADAVRGVRAQFRTADPDLGT
jgi:gluconokinase